LPSWFAGNPDNRTRHVAIDMTFAIDPERREVQLEEGRKMWRRRSLWGLTKGVHRTVEDSAGHDRAIVTSTSAEVTLRAVVTSMSGD
jgi:hypothetical protein